MSFDADKGFELFDINSGSDVSEYISEDLLNDIDASAKVALTQGIMPMLADHVGATITDNGKIALIPDVATLMSSHVA